MINSIADEFKNAFRRGNNATVQLILINVVFFLVVGIANVIGRFSGTQELIENFYREYFLLWAIPEKFITRPWALITYAFNHAGLGHILFNMIGLFWFGRLLQEYLGSQKVVNLYILGALVGGLSFVLLYNLPAFNNPVPLVGASGAVYAIIVAAATLIPNYTFFLIFIGPVRIKYIALFFVVISVLATAGANAGGNFAHLGGALIGYIYIRQMQKGNDIGAWIYSITNFVKSFFVRQSRIKVTHSSRQGKSAGSSGQKRTRTEQEEIDAILDKISESGYESLSKEEKQKLFEASRKN